MLFATPSGIEPLSQGPKPCVLPLYHGALVEKTYEGFFTLDHSYSEFYR
jgi:hypothetical protein